MKNIIQVILLFLCCSCSQINENKWGCINKEGKWVIKPKYDIILPFSHNLAAVSLKGKWGFIDKNDSVCVPIIYQSSHYCFSEDYAGILQKGKWGFVDKKGNIVIKPQFEFVSSFSNGLAAFRKNGKWGFVNKKGNVVIKPIFTKISFFNNINNFKLTSFSNGFAGVRDENRRWGLIDISGNYIIPPKYDGIGFYSNGLIPVMKDYLWGAVDLKDEIVIDFRYEYLYSYSSSHSVFKNNNKWGYVDAKGNEKIDKNFDFAFPFYERNSLAYMLKDYKYQMFVVDDLCNLKFIGQNDAFSSSVSEGIISIKENNKWGYKSILNKNVNQFIIDPKYSSCFNFKEGLASVSINGKNVENTRQNNPLAITQPGNEENIERNPR